MYQCKTAPIQSRKQKRVFKEAHELIREWRLESPGSRPYVRMKCALLRDKVFLDRFQAHIEEKSFREMVRRYRLLPCVRELLKKTTEEPQVTPAGNLMLRGLTPEGGTFRVIVKRGPKDFFLWTFYPG